jgi:hypothetical protein
MLESRKADCVQAGAENEKGYCDSIMSREFLGRPFRRLAYPQTPSAVMSIYSNNSNNDDIV